MVLNSAPVSARVKATLAGLGSPWPQDDSLGARVREGTAVAAGCGAKLESQTSSATSAEPATRSSWEQDIPIPFECAGAAIIFDQ
eukprot:7780515-Pyramimonas_sp.AAC.1